MTSQEITALTDQANAGVREAQYQLGVCYANGDGVSPDAVAAARWVTSAAMHGHVQAQCTLGLLYSKGEGVPQDYAVAAKWFRAAAPQEPRAGFNLALLQQVKLVPEAHPGELAELLRAAAVAGVAEAQFNLGVDLLVTADTPEAKDAAAEWLFAAAKSGLADAQYQLGLLFDTGECVERDPLLAVGWYELAAAQGHVSAQYNLGLHFELGHDGLERDLERACELYRGAAAAGHEKAIDSLIALSP